MRRVIITLVVGAIAAVLFQIGRVEAQPSVRISYITAGCNPDNGSLSGDVWFEAQQSKVNIDVEVVMTQRIPLSQGGSSVFEPVPGADTVLTGVMASGKPGMIHFGPFSMENVDPRADRLRVQAVNRDLNPAKLSDFPVCPKPTATPTLVPATPMPMPSAAATETPAVVTGLPALPTEAPVETPTVKLLPNTGSGLPQSNSSPVVDLSIVAVLVIFSVVDVRQWWFRRRRRHIR